MVGNTPNYTKFDVLRCFLEIDVNISRASLAKKLSLGEGTLRTILNILKKKGILDSDRQGHHLSPEGIKLKNTISSLVRIKKAESKTLYPQYKKVALLIKNAGEISVGYELRDIAVRNGAVGAMLILYKNGLVLPQFTKFELDEFKKLYDYENGDLLVVTFAESYKEATNAALAVATAVSKKLEKLLNYMAT